MSAQQILGDKYTRNGILAEVSDFHANMSADIYYEVVRIIGKQFLFLDDHLERLKASSRNSGLTFPGADTIRENLKLLLGANSFHDGNIRICLQQSSARETELLCYFVPWYYPDECTYLSGVQLVSYAHERPDPGIKKWDDNFRTNIKKHIRAHGVYEALLLNKQNQITEGSRSNVFFIDASNRLITPPEKHILPGITRKYVLQICRQEQIEAIEKQVSLEDLGSLEGCFISGTSPKILPVWQIDHVQFRADHPLVRKIMEHFEIILKKNLQTIL